MALYDVVVGYVGVVAAAKQSERLQQVPMIDTHEVNKRLNDNGTGIDQKNWVLLDVRDADERAADAIEGSCDRRLMRSKAQSTSMSAISMSAGRHLISIVTIR